MEQRLSDSTRLVALTFSIKNLTHSGAHYQLYAAGRFWGGYDLFARDSISLALESGLVWSGPRDLSAISASDRSLAISFAGAAGQNIYTSISAHQGTVSGQHVDTSDGLPHASIHPKQSCMCVCCVCVCCTWSMAHTRALFSKLPPHQHTPASLQKSMKNFSFRSASVPGDDALDAGRRRRPSSLLPAAA